MYQAFVVAIDGYSSCGKSTLAKRLASKLDFLFIDSGAMYRAISYYFLKQNINIDDNPSIQKNLSHIQIRYETAENRQLIFLNHQNVTDEIRSNDITRIVSKFSENVDIRTFATTLQQSYAHGTKGLVMDGRDIGTTVFPNAQLKFFITSHIDIRAERRYHELKPKNTNITIAQVKKNLLERDNIDIHRQHSPLKKAKDAIILENNFLTMDELVQKALSYFPNF